jgi:hypothetical protein
MKFSPGDPVWAWTAGWPEINLTCGEHAAVVICACHGSDECDHFFYPGYLIDVPGVPCPAPNKIWCCNERQLRPRRDDYQQREGLGSMDKIYDKLSPEERSKILGDILTENACMTIQPAYRLPRR